MTSQLSSPAPSIASIRSTARRVARRIRTARTTDRAPLTDRFLAPIPPATPTETPGPTVVILNDCRDQISFGSNALSEGLIRILTSTLPTATFVPIPSHWLIDASNGFGAFVESGRGMRQPWATYPTVADQFETVAEDWMEGRGGPGAREILGRLRCADLVILNGEGSIYRTNLSAIRELFLAWLARVHLGIPTMYTNGGMHLTDVVPVLPAMVRKTFRELDAVAIREPRSLRNLLRYAPDLDARLVPDAAFAFTIDDARVSENVSWAQDALGTADYFCFDPGSMPMDARDGRRSALYELISALKEVVPQAVFVPMMPADRYIESVARETNSLYIDSISDFREFMALVSQAQFLVSGRHHNLILAAISGCPTISFAGVTHKVHGVCEMFDGIMGQTHDGTDLRPRVGLIEAHARTFTSNREDIGRRLQELSEVHRNAAAEHGRLASDALASRDRAARSARTEGS